MMLSLWFRFRLSSNGHPLLLEFRRDARADLLAGRVRVHVVRNGSVNGHVDLSAAAEAAAQAV